MLTFSVRILVAAQQQVMSRQRVMSDCGHIWARFKRRILHAPNAIQTMHNEEAYLIIYCLNCIRCMQNSTFETGLTLTTSFMTRCC